MSDISFLVGLKFEIREYNEFDDDTLKEMEYHNKRIDSIIKKITGDKKMSIEEAVELVERAMVDEKRFCLTETKEALNKMISFVEDDVAVKKKAKVVILDNNPLSVSCYMDEHPETFNLITKKSIS